MATIKEGRKGVLAVPLGKCLSYSTEKLWADLDALAYDLDRARTGMARAWQRWAEDHPEHYAQEKAGMAAAYVHEEDGSVPDYPHGYEEWDKADQKAWRHANGFKGFLTYLYHKGTAIAGTAAGTLVSMAAREVVDNLKSKTVAPSEFRYRWEAVLANEVNLLTARGHTVPVPQNSAALAQRGASTKGFASLAAPRRAALTTWSESGAVLCLPLFNSGVRHASPLVRLKVGDLKRGHRLLFRKVVKGEFRWCDSELKKKEVKVGNKMVERWHLMLTYERPTLSLGLDPKNVAHLWPSPPGADWPFVVKFGNASWNLGLGRALIAEKKRIDARRFKIRTRYRDRTGSGKGHGRERLELKTRPWSRSFTDRQADFGRRLARDLVKFLQGNDCGSVVYHEPSRHGQPSLRDRLWFADADIPFDWTALLAKVQHKLMFLGIELDVEETAAKAYRAEFGEDCLKERPASGQAVDENQGTARKTEGEDSQAGVMTDRFGKAIGRRRNGRPLANGGGNPGRG